MEKDWNGRDKTLTTYTLYNLPWKTNGNNEILEEFSKVYRQKENYNNQQNFSIPIIINKKM